MMQPVQTIPSNFFDLAALQVEAGRLGFADVSVARFDSLPQAKARLDTWLAQEMHGSMEYMARNAVLRADPTQLLPQATSALLLRMNYLLDPQAQLAHSRATLLPSKTQAAQVSLYAQGRDYHTVLRQRLKRLVAWLQAQAPTANFRVFTDSAPVMEVELAQASGLGWRGKHTLLINREAGSMFFLGGILTTLDLPETAFTVGKSSHCGQCTRCIDICPTQAIIAPYRVDARRCISYLTIEHIGAIPIELRSLMGNRIYGCDDCQSACPWNKFAQASTVNDFAPRNGLDSTGLLALWAWTEAEFLERLQGSAIRRIGHSKWLSNIAIGLGNALVNKPDNSAQIRNALAIHVEHIDLAVREHVMWALIQ